MPHTFGPNDKEHGVRFDSQAFHRFMRPISAILPGTHVLESRGNRPLQMTFEDRLKAIIFFHLEEHSSARHLIQVLGEDDFARENIAPTYGIRKSSFSEAMNGRGLGQLRYVFAELCSQASAHLPSQHSDLGQLVALDGSLINAVFSMIWADYRKGSKKAKVHAGSDINRGIPIKIRLTDGKGAERPFFPQIISRGQTGIGDRGYQEHALFDSLQSDGKSFVIRIKANTTKMLVKEHDVNPDSIVFSDAEVLLGTVENKSRTENSVRLVGYRINHTDYRIATNRRELTAEQITEIYKLRWDIETFFAWWKRHLRVYHLIARSKYGLMTQIIGGLITYLLLAIYCHKEYAEKVSIRRVRELRIQIRNELRRSNGPDNPETQMFKERWQNSLHAKT